MTDSARLRNRRDAIGLPRCNDATLSEYLGLTTEKTPFLKLDKSSQPEGRGYPNVQRGRQHCNVGAAWHSLRPGTKAEHVCLACALRKLKIGMSERILT